MVTNAGQLVERYEYTPYGQRTVYSHGWFVPDLDGDGMVGQSDLDFVLLYFNDTTDEAQIADLNGDGVVENVDLGILLSNWGWASPSADPLVSYPHLGSFRTVHNWTNFMATPLCEFGHQGKMHDDRIGLKENSARVYHPRLGRWMQRDPHPAIYPDGMNAYAAYHVLFGGVDPFGLNVREPGFVAQARRRPCLLNCDEAVRLCLTFSDDIEQCEPLNTHCHNCCDAKRTAEKTFNSQESGINVWEIFAIGKEIYSRGPSSGLEDIAEELGKVRTAAALKVFGGVLQVVGYWETGRTIAGLKQAADDMEIRSKYRRFWESMVPGKSIGDFDHEQSQPNGCHIRGVSDAAEFRAGFCSGDGVSDEKRGFSVWPCYPRNELNIYYKPSSSAEWHLSRGSWTLLPSGHSQCLGPDEVINIEAHLIWGMARNWEGPR